MNILHLYTRINITCGVSRMIVQLASVPETTQRHFILCFGGDAVSEYKSAGLNITVINYDKMNLIRVMQWLYSFCKENKIDIIHSHHRYFDLLAYILSKMSNVKSVTSVHSKVRGRKIFSYKAKYLIAVSNTIREHLISYFGINKDKIIVINNFIDKKINTGFRDPEELKRAMDIDKDAPVVAFIGRFSLEKGIDTLLESFRRLADSKPEIYLLMIGSGEMEEAIEALTRDSKIRFRVMPPRMNILDYYRLADVIVLPSRVDPFPLVMLEAGLMQKAFIGSNVDGIQEMIINGKEGILIEPGNTEALASAIVRLCEDKALRTRLAVNLHNKVCHSYTAEKMLPFYEKLYIRIMDEA